MSKPFHAIARGECIEFLDDPGAGRMDEAMCCGEATTPGARYCEKHGADKWRPRPPKAPRNSKELERSLRRFL